MNFYETAVILNPNSSENEMKSAIDKISSLITSNGGEILKIDNWGKRKLSYELNKQKYGLYIFFLFRSPAGTIRKIEDYFKVYDIVVKFLVIRLSKPQIATIPKNLFGDAPVNPDDINKVKEG
ncbi:MAG TPA: 30S ribosomal protein S6 [Nitrospirae bacterium]|nr:30S ribosomal protein S6 [Nitrospirota bacterium]